MISKRKIKVLGKKYKVPSGARKILRAVPKIKKTSKRTLKTIDKSMSKNVGLIKDGVEYSEEKIRKLAKDLPGTAKALKKKGRELIKTSKKLSKKKLKKLSAKDIKNLLQS